MNGVVEKLDGRRLSNSERGRNKPNADYLLPGAVAELKILEQDALEQPEHQERIAKHFRENYLTSGKVRLNFKSLNDYAKADLRDILTIPIGRAAEKADAQIAATKQHLGRRLDFGIWIAVNGAFHSLPADEFENLVLRCARAKAKQIDFVFCTTVSYHQGDFDSYVFCESHCHPVIGNLKCGLEDRYIQHVGEEFKDRMTQMMRRLHDPTQWNWKKQEPVKSIIFTKDGVEFSRRAPRVPNSMFGE